MKKTCAGLSFGVLAGVLTEDLPNKSRSAGCWLRCLIILRKHINHLNNTTPRVSCNITKTVRHTRTHTHAHASARARAHTRTHTHKAYSRHVENILGCGLDSVCCLYNWNEATRICDNSRT